MRTASASRSLLLLVVTSVVLSGCAADAGDSAGTRPTSEADIVETTAYDCRDDNDQGVAATLTFRGDRLHSADVYGLLPDSGLSWKPHLVDGEADAQRDSKRELTFVSFDVKTPYDSPTHSDYASVSFTYVSKVLRDGDWTPVSLDAAELEGTKDDDGSYHGNVRLRVVIPNEAYEDETLYSMLCEAR